MNVSVTPNTIINHEQIAQRAHGLWEQAGHPDGRAVEFWLQAEVLLRSEQELAAKTTAKAPVKSMTPARRTNRRAVRA